MILTKRIDHAFGEVFHTALRKGSDTEWSVLLWNLIHMTDSKVWINLCDKAAPVWNSGKTVREAVMAWVAWEREGLQTQKDFDYASQLHTHRTTLMTAVELCDQQTWDDVEGWAKYCVGEET
jgi:hypothetical protein